MRPACHCGLDRGECNAPHLTYNFADMLNKIWFLCIRIDAGSALRVAGPCLTQLAADEALLAAGLTQFSSLTGPPHSCRHAELSGATGGDLRGKRLQSFTLGMQVPGMPWCFKDNGAVRSF